MKIVRRLFVVPLADNNHGKSTMIRALVSQGLGKAVQLQKKGVRDLVSPWGRHIDAYVFGRSYQEKEKGIYGSVEAVLVGNDPSWRTRELIIMPSHVSPQDHKDIQGMIAVGHSAGFDVISAAILLEGNGNSNRSDFPPIWVMPWDERWTIPNPVIDNPEGQLEALGRDLWTWICRALAS
jgi:hypothetical protein